MTRAPCHEVETLIDAEARSWNEAERLRVERHLEGCQRCRETLTLARVVRRTIQDAPEGLSQAARERALSRALLVSASPGEHRAPHRRASARWAATGVGFAAAAAIALFFAAPSTPPVASRAHLPAPPALSVASTAAPTPMPRSKEPVWIEAAGHEERAFAHATVQLHAHTRVSFDDAEATLTLDRGRIDVDVDASRGKPFSVLTPHFRVRVLGTRFVVTPESVSVVHGRVQVFARDGRVLNPALEAGASYSALVGATPAAAATAADADLSARVFLARARAALVTGNTKLARALVGRAEDSATLRTERAEATTLRAEAALLDRDSRSAIRLYLSVFDRYSDLSAGENALFAASQLSARSEPTRERALLNRSLARYPSGRFAAEVKMRLERLDAR